MEPYNAQLPTREKVDTALAHYSTDSSEYLTYSEPTPTSKMLFWEDGAGNEARLISDTASNIQILVAYDHESDLNLFPTESEDAQLALKSAPEEVKALITELHDSLVWSWDDSNIFWYTEVFWKIGDNEWESSPEWEAGKDTYSTSNAVAVWNRIADLKVDDED